MKTTLLLAISFFVLSSCYLKADPPSKYDFTTAKVDTVVNTQKYQAMEQRVKEYEEKERREREFMQQKEADARYFRDNWNQFLKITYATADIDKSWGGITDIRFALENSSKYKIDDVALVVRYFKANGDVYKTETVKVSDINPDDAIAVAAPDSPRGIRYDYYFESITSSQAEFCYRGIRKYEEMINNPGNDIYHCLQ